MLRNGGNDANYSKFKDTMLQNMVSGRGVETQQGTACVLFIDGEYWGLYTLQSDYSDRYFADRYNVAKSNVVMYKNDELSEGEAEDEKLSMICISLSQKTICPLWRIIAKSAQ